MAIITCPECNNQCSSLAESCPKCGYPFVSKNSTPILYETEVVKIRCWGRGQASINSKLEPYISNGWEVVSMWEDHWQGGLLSPVYKVTLRRPKESSYDYSVRKRIDDTPIGNLWICTSCGVENCGGGVCCNCSKARNNANKKVKIPKYQGKEWVCDYCGAHNDGKTSFCKHCNRMRDL